MLARLTVAEIPSIKRGGAERRGVSIFTGVLVIADPTLSLTSATISRESTLTRLGRSFHVRIETGAAADLLDEGFIEGAQAGVADHHGHLGDALAAAAQ